MPSMKSGYETAHWKAWNPPNDCPATATRWRTLRLSSMSRWARTMSPRVMSGKSGPYGLPVAGLTLPGPVEPYDEPSMLEETAKYRFVSIARPGPMRPFHQPPAGLAAVGGPAARWLPG